MFLFSPALSLITVVLLLIYRHLVKIYDYWKSKGVNGPTPTFPFGNTTDLAMHKRSLTEIVNSIYHDYPQEKLIGFYIGRMPTILVKDPDFIKHVLIKDFTFFRNRSKPISYSPLNDHIFFVRDEKWRLMRQKLTTMFTSGKLKYMFYLMNECVKPFHQYLEPLAKNGAELEIRSIATKLTLKMFGSCMFGIDMFTFTDLHNHYIDIGKKVFDIGWKTSLSSSLDSVLPGIISKLNIKLYNQEVNDFFIKLIRDMLKERAGKLNTRKDFVDLLLQLKEQGHIEDTDKDKQTYSLQITEELLAAQALVFYAGGFNGASVISSFLIHELAFNQDIQDKLYKEVRQVTDKYNGVMTYDAMYEMTYLNMVLAETLRKYSNVGIISRECTTDYTFPGTSVKIEKYIKVIVPIDAIHNDPKYFPNPEKFDPERFSTENVGKLQSGTYLPFGEGPRKCIAMRFANLQSMMTVVGILLKYQVLPSTRTAHKLKFDPKALSLECVDGIWVKMKIRD